MNYVEIANSALDLVGQSQIMSLDDNTVAARKAKLHIYDAIREVLGVGKWTSAKKTADLGAELSPVPTNGWAHRYQLPNDYVRLVTFNDTDPGDRQLKNWEIYGHELHTDETTATLCYICDLTTAGNDIAVAGPLLAEAFALSKAGPCGSPC
jgi:alpha-D-ribose 1-methylphosphonate 5-triphosphate diphosphatase PhnM